MDELVHHCLRELAFDGDLGCSIARLSDFIVGFYASQDDSTQLVDDAFSVFACSVIIQQPSVRVGILPPGSVSEVYIAPQTSAKRKAAAKGEQPSEHVSPSSLQLVQDARHRPLHDLRREYGDALRIAVDPETSFAAITGSHIRPSKLSPMVYSALQLITRGREDGITTVELGRKTKYDQKTCFYLIKQLVELGLVIKARRGGVGNHICIHNYFVQRSPLWKQIQEEEARNGDTITAAGEHAKPIDTAGEVVDKDGPSQITFDPIDSRHLSSLPLVKNRITKLLRASRNYIHPSNNLLITIGFVHPTKTDRRFFQTRLRELIHQGVIERVLVPSSKTRDRTIKCIRLVTSDNQLPEGSVVVRQDMDEDEKEASLAEDASVGHNDVKANLTIHKQVSNMLEEAGPFGLTLNEICASLGNFDKRTIELLLTRASNNRPPLHLGDLGTVDLMETYGRERRHRYYTLASYKCVMASEQLQDTTTATIDVDLSRVGDFAAFDPKAFYNNTTKLHSYQDSFKDIAVAKGKKHKRDEGSSGEESEPPKRKRGRPRKTPILADSPAALPRKRGRPRKNASTTLGEAQSTVSREAPSNQMAEAHAKRDKQIVGNVLSEAEQTMPSQSIGCLNRHNEVAVLHPTSETGVGNVSKKAVPRGSLKRSRAIALDEVDISVSRGLQALESNRPQENSAIFVAQEAPTATYEASGPLPTTGQGSSPSRDSGIRETIPASMLPRPSKRSRTNDKSRLNVNISALRRENELLKIIENMGGVANMHSRDIFDAHTLLLDTMSQAKEPTSAPVGTRLDKRTAESTLKRLENRGRIRMLKTSLITPSGVSRPAWLVYLPDTPQEKINAFLRQLTQNVPSIIVGPVKVLEEPVEYGPSVSSTRRASLPLNLLQIEDQEEKESKRLEQLFSFDSKTIRDVLLTERTTIAQLYGFVVGKALRMRQLHLHTLELFQQPSPSPFIISQKHRIIDITYFNQDITLALYCSLVAVVAYDEDLDAFFSSEGKQTPVKSLPPNLHTSLGVGRSRNKSRILELMEMLRSLGLVTPLEITEAPDAPFKCPNLNGETISFQNSSLEGWSASTPMLAPLFWYFHTSGPICLWTLSESSPSYWKEHPTRTSTEGKAYWDELRKVSRDQAYAQAATCPSTSPLMPAKIYPRLSRCLRRKSSWDPEHFLTWHQKQYLATKMDMSTGQTPLDAEDVDTQLDQICYIISAPRQVVVNYFTASGEKLRRDLESARRRIKRNRKAEEVQNIEAQSALRKKADETRSQREQDWEDILHRIHPEPLKGTLAVRICAVQSLFMQSTTTKDQPYWENEIEKAIKAQPVSKKITFQPKTKSGIGAHWPVTGPPPVVPNPLEKSVEFLIGQQGPPITDTGSIKRKGKAKKESEVSRRPRFHWTRDFDELARDASAIVRARCRASKLDLSALDQVFPAVPRNSVRQRVTHLRENAAEDVYMKRLEDQWYSLWLQYRGTPHLLDEDPGSPSNFNLVDHIEFLRKHVDKNALRVGFVERETQSKLTTSVKELYGFYEVEEDVVGTPAWDFMWGTAVEEAREKQFRSQAFTKEPDGVYEGTKNERLQLAETVLKMVFGAPSELYDVDTAARLLHGVGDQCVSVARSNLLHQGVLSKLVRDPKKAKPGRMLKISDTNLNSLGGPFPRDLFQDAISLEGVAIESVVDEMEWPLIASEGDVATLLQLVSEDQVDCAVDLSQSRTARQKIDWNSKRADDEDIETTIRLRFSPASTVGPSGSQDQYSENLVELGSHASAQEAHGTTLEGREAACTLKTETGLINCRACIDTAFAIFSLSVSSADRDLSHRILDCVRSFRESGLSKATCLGLEAGREQHVLWLAHKMTLTSPPILFWTSFITPTLVAGDYCSAWSLVVSNEPLTLIIPRRWLDLTGCRLECAWRTAQQAVAGVVFLRPGISQVELRWRLRAVYDRQEITDLASSLQEDGVLECRTDVSVGNIQSLSGWLKTVDEEDKVFWFIAKSHHWYQI